MYNNLPEDNRFKVCTIDALLFDWWKFHRSGRGLELSTTGNNAFQEAGLQGFVFDLNIDISEYKNLLSFPCPYFIDDKWWVPTGIKKSTNKITIYDSKIAVLVTLYGSVADYIKSIQAT